MTIQELAKQLDTTEQEIINLGISEEILNQDGTPTEKGYNLGYFEEVPKMSYSKLIEILSQLEPKELQKLKKEPSRESGGSLWFLAN